MGGTGVIRLFSQPWQAVSTCFLDTETTGVKVGVDRAVSVALVRFEKGVEVGSFSSLVNPGMPIPAEATEIHGIVDADVKDAPTIDLVFGNAEVSVLLLGAQVGAFCQAFDRAMVPPIGDEPLYPWIDPLTLVRVVDRYVGGKKRHTLEASCKRHGVELVGAHGALPDARACGELWYKMAPLQFDVDASMGDVLLWLRHAEADAWFDFNSWRARQPPKEGSNV
jgi:DNA polymerase III epsilon subunit-like protein